MNRYMRKADIKRVCAAFEQAIAQSRNGELAKFPCDEMFHCMEEGNYHRYICPIYNQLFPFGCMGARLRGETHETWLKSYYVWLTVFSMSYSIARKKLDDWEGFLRLDELLSNMGGGGNDRENENDEKKISENH